MFTDVICILYPIPAIRARSEHCAGHIIQQGVALLDYPDELRLIQGAFRFNDRYGHQALVTSELHACRY